MPVIFLLPWRRGRGRKPTQNQPPSRRQNGSNLAGFGKGLMRWRSQTRQRLNQRRQSTRPQPTIAPAVYERQAQPTRIRPLRGTADPQSDPAILLGDFFQDSSALPQYQTRSTSSVKERPDGFDLPQDLSDLGVAPRRQGVNNIETAAGRTFVSRQPPVTSPPPLEDPFDFDFEPNTSYVSMFDEDDTEHMPTTRLNTQAGPETVGAMWRNGQPPRPRVVGTSPLDELDEPYADEFEPEEEVLPPAPVELIAEPTYDPNRRGLRRRGGPRRQGIRFQNPRIALVAGIVSALMLAAIVFFIIYIAGQISKAPTDKFSVMFVPVANGPTYGVLNDGQTWQHYLGDNFLANGAVNADLRFSNASLKDASSATKQAENSLVDVLVWSYDDPNTGKLVSNLTLTPNGAYDPPVGRGRQLVERYLYDPATLVFVMPAPTGTTVNPSLSKLLVALSHYYAGNYDSALAGLSELLIQNQPQNEPGLRMLRGNVEFLMNNYAAAIEDYNQVININNAAIRNSQPTPINPAFVHNNRAVALTFQGNYQEANKSFTTALSTTDKLPKIFWNYAGFLLDHTEMPYSPALLNDQAIKLQNVTKLAPDAAVAFHYLGRIYYYLGDYDAAVDNENHARQLDPNYLEVYYWMGMAKLAKGQQEAALPNLNGALDVFRWGEGRANAMESQNRQRWQTLDNNGNKTLAAVWDTRANDASAQLDLMRFGIARAYLEETRLVGPDLGNPFDKISRAFGGKKAPVEEVGPRLQAYHDAHPNDPDGNFYLGQFEALTGQGDPAPLYRAAKDGEKRPQQTLQISSNPGRPIRRQSTRCGGGRIYRVYQVGQPARNRLSGPV